MYSVSVIISNKFNKNILKCLDSVLNQTLKNIEIICCYNNEKNQIIDDLSKKDNRIKLIFNNPSLNDINGEYVVFVENIISTELCELLYYQSKSQNLDTLYIPKYDFLLKNSIILESFKINPLNFACFYKKEFFNRDVFDLNCKSDFFKKSLYLEDNVDINEICQTTNEIIKKSDKSEISYVFPILINYLDNAPLFGRQSLFDFIKIKFNDINLENDCQLIYKIMLENDYYLDFFSKLKLKTIDYEVYANPNTLFNYKISIIIPIFNNETLIHRALMSIENQTIGLNNIEVLLINDGSKDNTESIINKYSDKYPNFKAIHIRKGTGSAGTPRNLGLKLASADYIMFLDHDDFLEIDALEKLYEKIIEYDCDVVYGTYALIDEDKPIKFSYPSEKHSFFKSLDVNPKSITTPPSIWTKLFRKDFLIENNILFPTILGEDAIFMAKALKYANGVYYLWDDVICYYNLNDKSYTSNLSYTYFVEGFVSEKYLFNLFCDWNHKEYYALRGQGILDYYINRFMLSKLNNDEINKLMPLFSEFAERVNSLNISPKNERNKIVFNYILKGDVEGVIRFKNYKPNKIKVISNKILNKINKHSFW